MGRTAERAAPLEMRPLAIEPEDLYVKFGFFWERLARNTQLLRRCALEIMS